MRKLVVGSRRSKLALTQSQQFIDKLKADPTLEIEIKEIVTKGDRIVNKQLSKVGGKDYLSKKSNKNFLTKKLTWQYTHLKMYQVSFLKV